MNARYSGDPEIRSLDATEARDAARAHYFAAYTTFAESAQLYAGTSLGHTIAGTAAMFLVAADAEDTNPPPRSAPDCACVSCHTYRLTADKRPSETEYVDVHPHVRPVADCPRCA